MLCLHISNFYLLLRLSKQLYWWLTVEPITLWLWGSMGFANGLLMFITHFSWHITRSLAHNLEHNAWCKSYIQCMGEWCLVFFFYHLHAIPQLQQLNKAGIGKAMVLLLIMHCKLPLVTLPIFSPFADKFLYCQCWGLSRLALITSVVIITKATEPKVMSSQRKQRIPPFYFQFYPHPWNKKKWENEVGKKEVERWFDLTFFFSTSFFLLSFC